MSLEHELISALSQNWPVTGRETDKDLARELLMEHGSQAETARALRVPVSRLRGWLSGKDAAEADRLRLLAAVRAARLPEGLDDSKIALNGIDHRNKPVKVNAKQLKIIPGTMDNIVDAYVAGDYTGMVNAMIEGIGEKYWYHSAFKLGAYRNRNGSGHPVIGHRKEDRS